jgi:hypothetical protein
MHSTPDDRTVTLSQRLVTVAGGAGRLPRPGGRAGVTQSHVRLGITLQLNFFFERRGNLNLFLKRSQTHSAG